MPIDPSIVLGLKPVPTIDPMALANQAAQYKNLISETAYRDQERQTNQQNQQRIQQQNAEADRKAQGDQLEGKLIAANTVTGQDGAVQTNHDAVRQGLAQAGQGDRAATYLTRVQIPAEKELLDNQQKKLDNSRKQLGMISSGLQSIASTPPEQIASVYDQKVKELTDQGLLKPGSVPSSAQLLQQGGIPAVQQFLSQHGQSAIEADKQLDIHQKDVDFSQKVIEFKQKVATEAPDNAKKWTDTLSQLFGAAGDPNQWQGAQKTAMDLGAPMNLIHQFGEFAPDAPARATQLGMTAEQRTTAANQQATLDETKARDAQTAKYQTGELAAKNVENVLAAKKFAAEFGGDAVKGWAATIKDNPDAASSVPANLRSAVQQQFTADSGLPFPKPLTGQTKTQETAARNVQSKLAELSEDIKDPEIQQRLGPILGRLGNAEQDVGATAGLSDQAAEKAQRIRTNMRYMVFQEGKALMGGRVPQNLMKELETSSPNTHMDAPTLRGALKGVQDNALGVLDSADQERFGGKMRSREDRGVKPVDFGTGGKSATKDHVAAYATQKGITIQQATKEFTDSGYTVK